MSVGCDQCPEWREQGEEEEETPVADIEGLTWQSLGSACKCIAEYNLTHRARSSPFDFLALTKEGKKNRDLGLWPLRHLLSCGLRPSV
jgi:hypothetical protein